MTDNGEDEVI